MDTLRNLFRNEAALAVGLLEALLAAAVAFGLDLDGTQTAAIVAVLVAAGSVLTRSQVYSQSSAEEVREHGYADGKAAARNATIDRGGPDGPDGPDGPRAV